MGITNEMSEKVKKQDRQFLGANTPITAKDKCFKYKGANKQKKRNSGYNKCNVRASKNAEQAFSRCEYPNHSQTDALNIKEPTNRKNESRDIANVMSEQVKMPNRHFLRCDIFTFAISRLSFFRLLLQLKALIR